MELMKDSLARGIGYTASPMPVRVARCERRMIAAEPPVDYLRGNGAGVGAAVSSPTMDTAIPRHSATTTRPVGELLREWRQRRRLSQLDFAVEAQISSKHLSFIETGRARPSREMLLKLAELLEVPLRERNTLLIAAGFAPMFSERKLDEMQAARDAMDMVLKGHEPYPALAIDRHWTMLAANRAVAPLLADIDATLLEPPVNVLRLSMHPNGLAPRIVNFVQWRAHLLTRLRRQIAMTADTVLIELLEELSGYPVPHTATGETDREGSNAFVVPLRLATPAGVLSFIGTTTVFGTPTDVTLSELALESFFPADAATAAALSQLPP
jgi:transcriptional regulator with XRE-family HTH domain